MQSEVQASKTQDAETSHLYLKGSLFKLQC